MYGSSVSRLGFASSDMDVCFMVDEGAVDGADDTSGTNSSNEEDEAPDGAPDNGDAADDATAGGGGDGDGGGGGDGGSDPSKSSFPARMVEAMAAMVEGCDFCDVDDAITTARIPILKLSEKTTGIEVDICINSMLPMYALVILSHP